MNAPISAALLQLRANAPAARVQPTVPHNARLLASAYEHDGIYLDLRGVLDSAGYDVEDVSLAGSTVALTALFSRDQLRQMSDWCDEHLPSAHALQLVSQQESRAERLQWERHASEPP
ncbi:hypothetical protein GJ698_02405 [Pseudoduganella sp. FT26W]|uniref:Uncharacterized protein n=1 Tax=Duganella aquatilis TaxID=2666082 RepID=A0A844D2P3_9BURK|nr:hypothetical protein [Duganella aquatilis]MRW82942.1 hypothetical protein [Duganella aquatilis]